MMVKLLNNAKKQNCLLKSFSIIIVLHVNTHHLQKLKLGRKN